MITICTNWPAKLALFIEETSSQPFNWTTNNCAFFACDWIAMRTGTDPAAQYRDSVDSALTAARALASAGGDGIESLMADCAAAHGWPEVALPYAQRGDVVSIDAEGGPALGVCTGAKSAFAGPHGIDFRPTASCRRAWRIT